ncbi:uroporphyrinogen decarboxylase family protein [Candidatus Hydrogenedentota bacterium]
MDFQPVVYEHAAALIRERPWDVSRNYQLLTRAHGAAYETYGHFPIIPGIDIYNLEAEAYGAVVAEPEGNEAPAIPVPLCSDTTGLTELRPLNPSTDGRIPLLLEAAEHLQRTYTQAHVRAPISGPFSIACNLLGFDTLLSATITEPESVVEALEFIACGQIAFCREAAARGLPVTIFESAATPPLLSPRLFHAMVLPSLKRIMNAAAELNGAPVACIIGGDTLPIVESMMQTEPGYIICPVETDQDLFLKKMDLYSDVMVRVNMSPSVFDGENMDAAYREADRVFKMIDGRKNMSVGSGVLPYDTKPETVLCVKEYIESKGV